MQVFFTPESPTKPPMLIYKIPEAGEVKIRMYNILGELVRESKTVQLEAGTFYFIPFTEVWPSQSHNYVALFEYHNQIIPCHFIR